jgi:hypothetical protein
MERDADFPAAHSMDTDWFAVDRDGHVGVFLSGEAGAVPTEAMQDVDYSECLMRLAEALPAIIPLFDLREWIGPEDAGRHHHRPVLGWRNTTLMFLESLDPVRDLLGGGLVVDAPPVFGVAVLFEELPESLSRRIHRAGACRACFSLDFGADWSTRLGLFCYSHACENWISGPYSRGMRPTRPIRIDQVPPDLRAIFERMRFPSLCFSETSAIQPVDHAPCDSWGNAYLGVDGKTVRAIPGHEEGYREEYEEWSSDPDLVVEPPPESEGD